MTEVELRLVAATHDDCDDVFRWANDPITRSASFSSDPIVYEDHCSWYKVSLRKDTRRLFIAVRENTKVGLIRFDAFDEGWEVAEIGINVAPEARGVGLGKTMLRAAADAAAQLGVRTIVAYVRPENEASRRAFLAVGYTHLRDDWSHTALASRFELKLEARQALGRASAP
jgi:RimJ/RimL family protein N-acetyltransferase